MRYKIDANGYISDVYFNCHTGTCNEYVGTIPDGYSSLEEWAEKANIQAYKIVDDNLVYDENKDNELKRKFEIEAEENKCATQKWVCDKFGKTNSVYDDELSTKLDGSSLFTLNNAKESEFVSLQLTPNERITGDLKINISNENMLENTALTQTISGITFTVNSDKTITLNGTATEEIEFILNGSLTNEEILFFLKNNTNYMKGGLPSNVGMNLYYYDGIDRELISDGGNRTLNFTDTKYITCVSLTIASGETFKNVKVSPMLTTGEYRETPYVEHKGNNLLTFDLGDYTFKGNDYISIERENIYFHRFTGLFPNASLKAGKNVFPTQLKEEVINAITNSLSSYEGLTIIQCDKNINFSARYFTKDYLNEQFASIKVEQDKITSEVSKKANATDLDNAVTEMNNKITQEITETENKINLEVSKKVNNEDYNSAQILLKINNDTSSTVIKSDKLDVDAIATFTNNKLANAGSTVINGSNITTGTISTDRLDSDVITTDNFSAQKINADNITSGTLSADKINGGTIKASTISLKNVNLGTSSSKIGGWTINSSSFSSGDSTINANGEVYFYPQITNGGILGLNTGFRCKAPAGVSIYNDTAYYGTNDIPKGITLLADSGNLTLGQKSQNNFVAVRSYCSPSARSNPSGREMLFASGGNIYLYSADGTIWAEANGLPNSEVRTNAGLSSSRSVKENIVEFENNDYENALNLLDKMKLYNYDYKYNMYKNPHKYGFIIDELEQLDETKQFFDFEEYDATVKDNKIDFSGQTEGDTEVKIKTYDSDVLDKYLLTVCKALYNKIEVLENKIKELESEKNEENNGG